MTSSPFRKYITLEQAKEFWPDHQEYPSIDEQLKFLEVSEEAKKLFKAGVKKIMMEMAEEAIDNELSIY